MNSKMTFGTKRGFTLLELAITMAVVGLLVGGLFQLVTSGTRTINSQVTAQQMQLITKTAKAWVLANRNTTVVGTDSTASNTIGTDYYAVNQDRDITTNVQNYRNNTLPTRAPSGWNYRIVLSRGADINSQAYYELLVTVTSAGGFTYSQTDVGQISAYAGGEGAGIYAATAGMAPVGACTPAANDTVRGAFGSVCVNLNHFTDSGAYTTPAPAMLSFINTGELDSTEDNYLWRVPDPSGTNVLNSMTTDLHMQGTRALVFDGTGNVTMNGGVITGPTGMTMTSGAISGPTALNMNAGGGNIDTNGGTIFTDGGNISLTNGDITGVDQLTMGNGALLDGSTANILNVTVGTVSIGGNLNANNLTAQSFIYTTSDRKLKKDIEPLSNSLDMLLQIQGVSYRLKSNNEKAIGVIAQDVQKVYPELVHEDQDHLTVNYQGLIGPLIEAVRELKVRNDELQKRVDGLEQKLKERE